MINISEIYGIVEWHKNRQNESPVGEHVGLFIVLPKNIAEQFPPQGREGEDSSPPHITFCYIGTFNTELESKLTDVCEEFFSGVKPFTVKLGSPKKFVNDEGQTVLHSPIKSSKLKNINTQFRDCLLKHQIPYDNKYPEYKPHSTIAYINPGEKNTYRDIKPQGSFEIKSFWLWGTKEPRMFYLEK